MNAFLFAIMALVALATKALANTRMGEGTAYSKPFDMNATGQNMCEFNPRSLDRRWNIFYAAMNEADWNAMGGTKKICGKCIQAWGRPGQMAKGHKERKVIVKIVDQCPSWACKKGNVDFSTAALEAITGFDWDRKDINWRFVDCNTGKPTGGSGVSKNRRKKGGKRGLLMA